MLTTVFALSTLSYHAGFGVNTWTGELSPWSFLLFSPLLRFHHLPGVPHRQMVGAASNSSSNHHFGGYKCVSMHCITCTIQPTTSPLSSWACIRTAGLPLHFCAALTFCLCLFECHPRTRVLDLQVKLYSRVTQAVCGVSKSEPPPTSPAASCRLLHGPQLSYPQCYLSFFISLYVFLFHSAALFTSFLSL